jgi:hypothetical protein
VFGDCDCWLLMTSHSLNEPSLIPGFSLLFKQAVAQQTSFREASWFDLISRPFSVFLAFSLVNPI